MDQEAASFVVDRIDVARMALTEVRQAVEKYAEPEDDEVGRLLDDLLARLNLLDANVRCHSCSSP